MVPQQVNESADGDLSGVIVRAAALGIEPWRIAAALGISDATLRLLDQRSAPATSPVQGG